MHPDFARIVTLTSEVVEKLADVELDAGERKLVAVFETDIAKGRFSEHKLLEVCSILSRHTLRKLAVDVLSSAVLLLPNSFSVLERYARILGELKKWGTAEQAVLRFLENSKDDWPACQLLGRIYFRQNKQDQQLKLIEDYLGRYPRHIPALIERLSIKMACHSEGVVEAIDDLLNVEPTNVVGLSKKLIHISTSAELEGASELLRQMQTHHLDHPLTAYCQGILFERTGNNAKALQAYEKAISIDPKFLEAYGKSGQMMLRLGLDLKEAWHRLEARLPHLLECPDGPLWRGEDLKYKNLFIWAEQGIGDQIDFSSMLRDLPNNIREVNIEVDKKLVDLFQRSFPNFYFHQRDSDRNFDYDFHSPIGAIARYLRTTYESFTESPVQYLKPDDKAVKKWQGWLNGLGAGKKVGLTWKSGLHSEVRRAQRLGLCEEYGDILKFKNCHFISIFYGEKGHEIQEVEDRLGVKIHIPPNLDQFNNLDETAGLLKALDVCFGVASAPVMLSKAVGTETFIIGGADKVAPLWWPDVTYIAPDAKQELIDFLAGP